MSTLARIRAELPPTCRILAVSKLQSVASVQELARQGQMDFGENYLQEARGKQDELASLNLCWHFIGRIQKNKAKDVVGNFAWLHSVDSLELARVLDQRAAAKGLRQNIFLQINLAAELTKGGFARGELEESWDRLRALKALDIRGLMTMPPLFDDANQARPYFRELRDLRDQLAKDTPTVDQLSMGTSHDYRVAAEEGATWVRLGTLLFGERPPR